MKHILLLLAIFNCYLVAAQKQRYGILKKANELIVTSFTIAGKGKMAVVCKDSSDMYLVYRYGTPTKIELAYPEVLDTNSWHEFYYYNYHRGGGIANEGMDEINLSFINKGIKYRVYETYYSGDELRTIGILIKFGDKEIDLQGDFKTKCKSIGDLNYDDDRLPNSLYDSARAIDW